MLQIVFNFLQNGFLYKVNGLLNYASNTKCYTLF